MEIRELGGKRRHLVLTGDAGPLAGGSFGASRQRGEIQRYAGSAHGVARQMGSEPLESEWDFDWSVSSLIGGQAFLAELPATIGATGHVDILDPEDMRRLIGSMCDDGQLVEVVFDRFVNIGLIREQVPTSRKGRAGTLLVAVSFEWLAVERPAQRLVQPPRPEDTARSLEDQWGDLLATVRRPLTMARAQVDAAKRAVQLVNRSIRRTSSIVAEVRSGIRSVNALSSGMATGLTSVVSASYVLRDAVDLPGPGLAQSDDAKATVEALSFRAKAQRKIAQVRRRAAIDRGAHRVQSDPTVLGVHEGREGEDLRYVAVVWYGAGNADLWRLIAKYNHLTNSLLTAGQQVLIPAAGAALAML